MHRRFIFLYVFLVLMQYFVAISEPQLIFINNNLNISNNSTKKSSGFYAKISRHVLDHRNLFGFQPYLQIYSAVALKQYFTGYTPTQIFDHHTFFTSDEFIKFAKTVPGYESKIDALYKKFCKKSSIGKWWHSKWGKRIKKLCQELQEQKQVEEAAIQRRIEEGQRKRQSEDAYKQKLEIITQQSSYSSARVQALDVSRKNPSHRTSRFISIDKAVIECAEQYGITKQDLTTGSMNAYEHQLHEEFVDQLAQLTYLADTYHMSKTKNLLLDAIGEGVALGIEANKKYEPAIATRWTDFGWEVLDIAKGIAEGVGLGAYNTACFAKNVVCHPIRTTCEIAYGLSAIVNAVGKAVGVPVRLGALCVTGNAEEAYKEAQEMYEQTKLLMQECTTKLAAMSNREIAKQTTAFAADWVLTGKALTLGHSICSRAGPLLADVIEVLRKEPAVEYAVAGAEGAIHHMSDATKQVGAGVKDVVKSLSKPALEIKHPVLDNIRTGSALKLDAHHAFHDLVDNFARIAKKFSLKGKDGILRELYQIKGSLNGIEGVFEWIVDPRPNYGVTHRLFIKNGKITGRPNAF